MIRADTVLSTERARAPISDPAEAYAERRRLRELRTALEATLDEMVSLLDTLDGDTDVEPSLGAGGLYRGGRQ